MNTYYYCVNTFEGDEPVQLRGHIEAESEEDAVQTLIDNKTVDSRGYEFLTLEESTDLLKEITESDKHLLEKVDAITKINPQPEEIIVVSFNFDDIGLDDVRSWFDEIKAKFSNNTVIAIPNVISLRSCSKEVLKDIINMISEIIQEEYNDG